MPGSGRFWNCGDAGAASTARDAINASIGYPKPPTQIGAGYAGGNLAGGTSIALTQYVNELLGVAKPAGSTRVVAASPYTSLPDRIIDATDLLPADVVICMGQSNELGFSESVGDLSADVSDALQWIQAETVDSVSGERLRTQLAAGNDPLSHVPVPNSGRIGSAVAFARDYIAATLAPGRQLVLVPCAQSGTSLVTTVEAQGVWSPGGTLFELAVTRALSCLSHLPSGSAIVGAFFTQGENDGTYGVPAATYQAALDAMIAELRSRLSLPSLPVVVSTLPATSRLGTPYTMDAIDLVLRDTPNRVANTACVITDGLATVSSAHYSAASYRLIGPLKHAALVSLIHDVPDAPTIGTATAGDEEISIAFTPGDDGGTAVTVFTATASPSGLTGTGASSPITITGLTNGVEQTVSVTAANAVGTSSPSAASNAVTPEAPAGTPSYWYPSMDLDDVNAGMTGAGTFVECEPATTSTTASVDNITDFNVEAASSAIAITIEEGTDLSGENLFIGGANVRLVCAPSVVLGQIYLTQHHIHIQGSEAGTRTLLTVADNNFLTTFEATPHNIALTDCDIVATAGTNCIVAMDRWAIVRCRVLAEGTASVNFIGNSNDTLMAGTNLLNEERWNWRNSGNIDPMRAVVYDCDAENPGAYGCMRFAGVGLYVAESRFNGNLEVTIQTDQIANHFTIEGSEFWPSSLFGTSFAFTGALDDISILNNIFHAAALDADGDINASGAVSSTNFTSSGGTFLQDDGAFTVWRGVGDPGDLATP